MRNRAGRASTFPPMSSSTNSLSSLLFTRFDARESHSARLSKAWCE